MTTCVINTRGIPDLIILVYLGNLRLAQAVLAELFPDTSVVVTGLTEEILPAGAIGGRATGVAQRSDPDGTIKSILRLQPDVKRIVVIGGTAEVDRQAMNRTMLAAQSFADSVKFEVWDKYSLGELLKAVTSLPPHTAVLFTRMFRDGAEQAVNSATAGQSIAKVANVPVYAMTDTTFGSGMVGGSVSDIAALGQRAGELAHRVLNGAEPKSIPLEIITHGTAIFDWRALKRWGFDETQLPPGSVVRYRPNTFWEQYKWLIILVLTVCIVEAALIDILLRERRRRRFAQRQLEERLRLEQLVSELSGTFINLPPDKVEGQIIEALGRVGSLLRFDIVALSLFVGPGFTGRVGHIWKGPGVPEIPSNLTDQDFPWMAQELFAGHDVSARTLDELPPQAHTDRATYERYHVRSTHNVPMVAGGRVIGVLGFCTVWAEREMSRELLQGQRLLAETFANAIARKQTEESLRESEQNFRGLVESTAAVPWRADIESWVFTYVGPQAVKLLGYPIEQWYEKDFWMAHVHPDDREFAIDTCLTLSKSAGSFEFEYRMIARSGKTVWVHDIVKCEYERGKPVELRGFMLDISERKHNEAALRESEERFRLMADSAPVMIWMSDTDKLCTYFNKPWLDFTGRAMEQELGDGWAEGVHPDDSVRCLSAYLTAFSARQSFMLEYRLRRYDGEYRWVVANGLPRHGPDGNFNGYIGSCIDITERRRAEEKFRLAVEASPNAIVMTNPQGEIVLVNEQAETLFGYLRDELIGQPIEMLVPERFRASHPGHRAEFRAALQARAMGAGRDLFARRKDGTERLVEIGLAPIHTQEGTLVLTAILDITERRRTELELRKQRQELIHISRVSTMGELAASIAHELNQPLTAILSNAQAAQRFLAASPPDMGEVREILKDIVQDNSRAGEVIRRMRALVKKGELDMVPLDIASVIRDVMLLVHSDATLNNIHLSLAVDSELQPVRGDKVQLQQVVLNLLLNAFDAMKDRPPNEREVKVRTELDGGNLLKVAVRDYGTGLSADAPDKLFQPFYTTKGDGLGMGLSICHSIIEAHGGRLWAENNSDQGATFYFTVPFVKSDECRESNGARRGERDA